MPAKPSRESRPTSLRFTTDTRKLLERAARRRKTTFGSFVRAAAVAEANRVLGLEPPAPSPVPAGASPHRVTAALQHAAPSSAAQLNDCGTGATRAAAGDTPGAAIDPAA